MATYTVTTSNWNDPAFWAAIMESSGGHTLDFSALPSNFSVLFDYRSGTITISDGTTSFDVNDSVASGKSDVTLGGTAELNFFDFLGSQGDDTIIGDSNAQFIDGGAGIDEVSYAGSGSAVNVDLSTGTGSGGNAAGDTYANIENIIGSDHDDTLTGDAGDNSFDAGLGADSVSGGGGNDLFNDNQSDGADTFDGGAGSDTIDYSGSDAAINVDLSAGTGSGGAAAGDSYTSIEGILGSNFDDTISGDAGDNYLVSGDGNDSVFGGSGDDTLIAGEGNVTLIGGEGDDSLVGGKGSDVFHVAEGDFAQGNEGDDLFLITDLGEAGGSDTITIVGDEDGETDGDTINFQGLTTWDDITMTGAESGTAILSDGTVVTFSEIENIVVCYAVGTHILTPEGERDVASLAVGDLVVTADHGPQPIRWIRRTRHDWDPGPDNRKPILFAAGSLGAGLPRRDLMVSPQHRMLVPGAGPGDGVLVPAKAMTGLKGVRAMNGRRHVDYVHLMFDRHEVILAEGTPSESFFPGDVALRSLSAADRDTVRRIVLRAVGPDPGAGYPPARELCAVGPARRMLAGRRGPVWTESRLQGVLPVAAPMLPPRRQSA